jgi:ATPase family protein associated with various cellular activities (AAA)
MPDPPATFSELRRLKTRLAELSQSQLEALDPFHITEGAPLTQIASKGGRVNGFLQLLPDVPENLGKEAHVSLTSTATCIRSLALRPGLRWDPLDFVNLKKNITDRYPNDLTSAGLEKGNPYTLGQLVAALKMAGFQPDDPVVTGCLKQLREHVAERGVRIQEFSANGYLTYWCLVALATWDMDARVLGAPSIEWSGEELYRQISFFAGGDDEKSDAFQLGYNLLIQYRFNRSVLRDTIVGSALSTLFEAHLPRGVWEKKDPLFVYGKQAGDAYCFSFELLNSILSEFREDFPSLLPYEAQLRNALGWIERNAMLTAGDPQLRLWRSGHRVQVKVANKAESWATAEVHSFLHLYGEFVSRRMQDIVLGRYRGHRPIRSNPNALDAMDQPTLQLSEPKDPEPDMGTAQPFNDLLRTEVLDGLAVLGTKRAQFSLRRNPDPRSRKRSLILTGPPRSGKSSAATAIAEYLGWPLVTLDPGDFAREGLLMLPTMAASIFEELSELDDSVVFFDEMEEFMRTREGNEGVYEQRLLTTSLLPKLQALRDRARCIFIVATNFFDVIDSAAAAPGRFDLRLKLLPRSTEAGSGETKPRGTTRTREAAS